MLKSSAGSGFISKKGLISGAATLSSTKGAASFTSVCVFGDYGTSSALYDTSGSYLGKVTTDDFIGDSFLGDSGTMLPFN